MSFVNYKNTNNAYSKLIAGISANATTVLITDGDQSIFPDEFPFLLTIEHEDANGNVTAREIVKVTGMNQNSLVIERGAGKCVQDDTASSRTQANTPHSFSAGDKISLYFTSEQLKDIQEVASKSVKSQSIGADYSSTQTYSVGDIVMFEGTRYVCSGETTGSFDPSKWSAITVQSSFDDVDDTIDLLDGRITSMESNTFKATFKSYEGYESLPISKITDDTTYFVYNNETDKKIYKAMCNGNRFSIGSIERPICGIFVGGGGAGGGSNGYVAGGGGGGGEIIRLNNMIPGSYTISIGSGGTGRSAETGKSGTSTTVVSNTGCTYTARGGCGGEYGGSGGNSGSGCSGGAVCASCGTGGGGGACGAGFKGASTTKGGNGGLGFEGMGGGGGGGGCTNGTGCCGGGSGGGSNATGYGGGGGGKGISSGSGGSGCQGVVIFCYLTGKAFATGGTVTTSGDYTIHTFTTAGTFLIKD